MAKLLAHHGMAVSIIITPLNAIRFNEIIDYAKQLNLSIHFISLKFPGAEVGLPEGCENMDSLPSPSLAPKFFDASNMLQKQLENLLAESEIKPDCIVSDLCFPWTSNISIKFNIPRLIFHTVSCFCLLCCYNIERHKVIQSITSSSEPFLIPDIPDKIEFTKPQLPMTRSDLSDGFRARMTTFREAEDSAEGILVNTFEELEPRYVEEYNKVKRIWCMGPLFFASDTFAGENYNKAPIDHEALQWLDSKPPSTVIYVCFGSLSRLKSQQLMEIGLGLEASNHSFIWVIRNGDQLTELEKWFEEYKFEEKNTGRGLIIKGWAPQVSILSHSATGGFLTHCGWNSTLEGVTAGKPMGTWPMFAEQFYNEKLLVEVLKIGVRVGVETSVPWAEKQKIEALVEKGKIKKAVEMVMEEGGEGEERRRRAREIGESAKKALKEGGSSYLSTTSLIQHIMKLQISRQ